MLIFIIEDVHISEDIFSDATAGFIYQVVEKAKLGIIGASAAFVVFNIAVVFIIVYYNIVKPITELTD